MFTHKPIRIGGIIAHSTVVGIGDGTRGLGVLGDGILGVGTRGLGEILGDGTAAGAGGEVLGVGTIGTDGTAAGAVGTAVGMVIGTADGTAIGMAAQAGTAVGATQDTMQTIVRELTDLTAEITLRQEVQ